jgi:hypothetical protein
LGPNAAATEDAVVLNHVNAAGLRPLTTGFSLFVITNVTREALARLKLSKGESVYLTETPQGYLLTPYDPGLDEQIQAGRQFMHEFRDTFHQLAK